MDLRGHGLSDAPTDDGAYDLAVLADDVVAVAEGSGLLDDAPAVTLVGHGFGAIAPRRRRPCSAIAALASSWSTAGSITSRRRPGSMSRSSCAVSTSRRR